MSRSLSIRDSSIHQVKLALKRNGFHSQRALAESTGYGLSTVGNFLRGKPVDFATFSELCAQLHLDWQTMTDVGEFDQEEDAILSKPSSGQVVTPPRYQDWGEAPDVSLFFNRESELSGLQTWIRDDKCRIVTVLGMGGVGKTSLAVKLAQQLQETFDAVVFRSLRNAPDPQSFFTHLLQVLSRNSEPKPYHSVSELMTSLVKYIQASRCLIILDNVESILEDCDRAGRYRVGYELYGQFLRLLGETTHDSCLILTSRQKPNGLKILEGDQLPARCLQLKGLQPWFGRQIFERFGTYYAEEKEWTHLVERYAGNPLALKIVASFIRDCFGYSISSFLEFLNNEPYLFDGIRDLLEQQIHRLSPIEFKVLHRLAKKRDPISLQDLQKDGVDAISKGELLQTLTALTHRSLIEKSDHRYTLQPVLIEYVMSEFKVV